MAFIFPKRNSYETPEGEYQAVVSNAFEKNDGVFRIVFSIKSLKHSLVNYLAGKNYAPGKDTVANDLIDWLGLDALQAIIREDGTIDAAKLKGLHADIKVEHIVNDEYEHPYVFIKQIASPGSLTQNSSEAA